MQFTASILTNKISTKVFFVLKKKLSKLGRNYKINIQKKLKNQYREEIQPLLIEDPTKVINWMKNKGLLRNYLDCSKCYLI